MKFRYFKDEYISFYIDSFDEPFETLKDAISYLYLTKQFPEETNITMQERSTDRSSSPNHILHFCQLAVFTIKSYKKKLKLNRAYFQFRDHIDLKTGFAKWYSNDPSVLYFFEYTDGDRDATIYFKEVCEDRELADYLLSHSERVLEY